MKGGKGLPVQRTLPDHVLDCMDRKEQVAPTSIHAVAVPHLPWVLLQLLIPPLPDCPAAGLHILRPASKLLNNGVNI